MQTPRDSALVSSHRVHKPSRVVNSWVQDPGDHRQGSRQVLWVLWPLGEQISGTWVRAQPVSESEGESGVSRLQLSPSHERDIGQVAKSQFLHLKTMSSNGNSPIHLTNKTTYLLSKCQPPSPVLPNHEWLCTLDSEQKSPKGTHWILGLWSETRLWNADTIASLSPKGFIFTFGVSWVFIPKFLDRHLFRLSTRAFKWNFFFLIHNYLPIIPEGGC